MITRSDGHSAHQVVLPPVRHGLSYNVPSSSGPLATFPVCCKQGSLKVAMAVVHALSTGVMTRENAPTEHGNPRQVW
jgi:hypothetical protein